MDWFAASLLLPKGPRPKTKGQGHTLHRTTLSLLFITVTQ